MKDIKKNYQTILKDIKEATLIIVSKNQTIETIKEVYDLRHLDFGENRLQEALLKMEQLPKDIRWHFIGNLQLNKVNKAVGKFVLFHGVDSLKLCQKISECSQAKDITTSILLQVNISGETSKHGFSKELLLKEVETILKLPALKVEGLMTMAPLDAEKEQVRSIFKDLRELKEHLGLKELSMGMSQDYKIALEEGATFVRIGSLIFG